jgi:hypothetical protein
MKLHVLIALIQIGLVFFMIAGSTWGQKHAVDKLKWDRAPQAIEFWHRWSTPLLAVPVCWAIIVTLTSADRRYRKINTCLLFGGIVITGVIGYQAIKVLLAVLHVMGRHPFAL